MQLEQWHQSFNSWIVDGDKVGLKTFIKEDVIDDPFTSNKRLHVYRNNYTQALISALKQTYELCVKCVGDEYFAQLAKSYIKAHPPVLFDINSYGEQLANYLEQLMPEKKELEGLAYLPDLARLDWLCNRVYFAANPQYWDAEQFNALSAEQQMNVVPRLSSDCFLLRSNWSLLSLWTFLKNDEARLEVKHSTEGMAMLVTRVNYQASVIELKPDIYSLLKVIEEGVPLYELASGCPDSMHHLPELISQRWVSHFDIHKQHD